jgi:hypothetical protein
MMSAQSMQALERANEVRLKQADLRRQIKTGELDPRAVLAAPPAVLDKIKVGVFLRWCPRVGDQKAEEMLRHVRVGARHAHFVSPSLPLGRLSEPTRLALAEQLPVTAAMRRAA